jgi:regulator of chromosome condensation
LNQLLSSKDVGVVQIAVGGMHCAALTHDHKILTWGVNDQGALGRHTGDGPMKDMKADDASDSDSDDDDEDSGLNPDEATPREVDPKHFPAETKFVSLHAGDSSTFALTTTGLVYGWGTFRVSPPFSNMAAMLTTSRAMMVSLASAQRQRREITKQHQFLFPS